MIDRYLPRAWPPRGAGYEQSSVWLRLRTVASLLAVQDITEIPINHLDGRSRRCGGVLHQVADPGRVQLDARAHRRGHRDRAQIAALRRRRLGAKDLLQHRLVVLDQRLLVERLLAERRVHDPGAVGAVLDLARLDVADGLADVEGDGAGLGAGHLALRAEDAAQPPDGAHHVGRGDRDVEVAPTLRDARGQVIAADHVGAGLLGLLGLLALREHGHRHRLAETVRQEQRPAQLLVGVAYVH